MAEIALRRGLETTPAESAATGHAHATYVEAIREAALALDGGAIHCFERGAPDRRV
jgi:hypothetical protein